MSKKNQKQGRGCGGLLALSLLAFGSLACAWSFYLAQTQAGQEVDWLTGLSFYAGWICGIGFIMVSAVISFINSILRRTGNLLGKATGGMKDGVKLPGGLGGIASIGVLNQFIRNRR